MHLRQVAAVGAEFLPDIGHRVEADDIDAAVAEVQHVLGHVVEHRGIAVVQVPLIGIEGRHDDFVRLVAPAEIPGGRRREDLRNGPFKQIGNRPVLIEEVALLRFRVAGTGLPRPFVILARMVHHKIEADRNAAFVTVRREGFQIFHRAQLRLDTAEIRHRIAAVAAPRRAHQQGHQVQIVDAAFRDIIELLAHALQRARKGVGIHQSPQQMVAPVPFGVLLAGAVHFPQGFGPLLPAAVKHPAEIVPGLLIAVIEFHIESAQLFRMPVKALAKLLFPFLTLHSFRPFTASGCLLKAVCAVILQQSPGDCKILRPCRLRARQFAQFPEEVFV